MLLSLLNARNHVSGFPRPTVAEPCDPKPGDRIHLLSTYLCLMWLLCVTIHLHVGSCSQPQSLCCLGIDHHCKRGSCYCDEFCHVVSDCYPDHHALCNPASQNTKMVLRMVLRIETPPRPARSNLDWMQRLVQQLLHTSLPGRPLSISVREIKKRA
ncbi:uncharacterized protein LOC144234390 [Crocuta crocuta]